MPTYMDVHDLPGVKADDVAVASDHGRELLDYVLADLERTD